MMPREQTHQNVRMNLNPMRYKQITSPKLLPPTAITPDCTEAITTSPSDDFTCASTVTENSVFSLSSTGSSFSTIASSFGTVQGSPSDLTDAQSFFGDEGCYQPELNSSDEVNLGEKIWSYKHISGSMPAKQSYSELGTMLQYDADENALPDQSAHVIEFPQHMFVLSQESPSPRGLLNTSPPVPEPSEVGIQLVSPPKYRCDQCNYEPKGKESNKASNLKRHKKNTIRHAPYGQKPKVYRCHFSECQRFYYRSDNLVQHQKRDQHSPNFTLHGVDEIG